MGSFMYRLPNSSLPSSQGAAVTDRVQGLPAELVVPARSSVLPTRHSIAGKGALGLLGAPLKP